jgi:endonuclease/exonuclease/phosphatase family metal-dependent hydrolase
MKMLKTTLFYITLSILACTPGKGGSGDGDGGGGKVSTEKITLKVMSFNIRTNSTSDLGDTNWLARREPCKAMIDELSPDVIAMQEPRTAQRDWIKENLPNYRFLEVAGTGDGKGGNTVMLYRKDRFTQLSWGSYYLSDTPDEPSTPWSASTQWHVAVWVRLRDNASGKTFTALSTHLPSQGTAAGQTARVNGVKLNISRMEMLANSDDVAFIAGDMNCSYSSSDPKRGALTPYYEWGEDARAIAPAGDVPSFNAFGKAEATPLRTIDCIFYRNCEAVSFRTISENVYGVEYISDHYPLLLTAEF